MSATSQSARAPDVEPFSNLIHEMSLMVARAFNRQVKDIGLTRTQWQVLYLLYRQDGQTQTYVAEALTMAKPPLGKVIDRLEADGWVERREDANDRRAKRVYLTGKVMPLIEPLEQIVAEIGEVATSSMSAPDKSKLISLLRTARANLARAESGR